LAEGEAKFIPNQVATTRLLEKIDSWGKVLTAVVVVYGFALGAFVLYNAWVQSQKMLTH
jgi:hypothetical protein